MGRTKKFKRKPKKTLSKFEKKTQTDMRLFLTLLLAAFLGLALADGHSDDREVQAQPSGTEGQIESRGANGNEIDLEYRLGSGEMARFDLEFKSETNSTETELDVRVRLIEIFEYTPSAPGAAFPDNGTKLNVYGPGTWNNIQASTANNVTTWSASTTDGAVSIDLFFTDSPPPPPWSTRTELGVISRAMET